MNQVANIDTAGGQGNSQCNAYLVGVLDTLSKMFMIHNLVSNIRLNLQKLQQYMTLNSKIEKLTLAKTQGSQTRVSKHLTVGINLLDHVCSVSPNVH